MGLRLREFLAAAVALLSLLLLLAPNGTAAEHLFPTDSGIVELTQKTFDRSVMGSDATYAVLFYAPWCGYCKQFAPEFARAAKRMRGLVHASTVNCDEEKELCSAEGIRGFPVLKVYYTNIKSKRRIPSEFNGERVHNAVVDFATGRLPNFVKPVAHMGVEKFYALANETLPKVVVVKPPSPAKKATSPLLKALAIDYRYRLVFGEVSGKEGDAAYEEFAPPTGKKPVDLKVITLDGEVVSYDGEIKQTPLREFLDQHALKKKISPEQAKESGKKQPKVEPKTEAAGAHEEL